MDTELIKKQYAVINAMTDLLWNHREYLEANGGNTNAISWIDDDLDLIDVAYFDREPDGDNQWDLVDQGLRNTFTFADAFELLKVRMENSDLFDR